MAVAQSICTGSTCRLVERGCFVDLEREAIWIAKKGKPLIGVLVDSDVFGGDLMATEVGEHGSNILHLKGQVPKATGLGIGHSRRRRGKTKQLDLAVIGYLEIQLVGLAVGPIDFLQDLQSQYLCVKVFGSLVVRGYDGHVVDAGVIEHDFLWGPRGLKRFMSL